MYKFFGPRDNEPFITIADIFGYVIAFFILWLLLLGYRTISKASTSAHSQLQNFTKPVLTVEAPVKEAKEPTQSFTDVALDLISSTSNKASKLLTKEGAEETIYSVNSYIDSVLGSTTEVLKEPNSTKKSHQRESEEDSLSSF